MIASEEGAAFARHFLAPSCRSRLDRLMSREAIRTTLGLLGRRLATTSGMDEREWKTRLGSSVLNCRCPKSIVTTLINNWRRFVADFASHTESFQQGQGLPFTLGRVRDVTFDFSECHSGGRSVVRVLFEKSRGWYYKPRSGKLEEAWGHLLLKLNQAGFSPAFAWAPVLSKANHCWMPEIPHLPCQDWGEVERFYIRAGALLCLAHLFRAVDLHAGNFIANGEHPVLIDSETLMHRNVRIPPNSPDRAGTLWRTGMLPVGRPGDGSNCVSFLGRVTPGPHTAYLGSRQILVKDAIEPLVKGFQAMNGLVKKIWTRPPFQKCVRDLQSLPVRTIYRPTAFYIELLEDSLSPEYVASQEARRFFLQGRLKNGLVGRAVVQGEINQLVNCDIPLFYRRSAAIRSPLSRPEMVESLRILRESCAS